jgi:hypothetical protein
LYSHDGYQQRQAKSNVEVSIFHFCQRFWLYLG